MRRPGGDVMRDIVWDNIGRRKPEGLLPQQGPVHRGTGWQAPAPLPATPPGDRIIGLMLDADSERQRLATPEGRRAKAQAMVKAAQKALEAEDLGAEGQLEEVIAWGMKQLGGA
jgi:hypothetical protein